MTNKPKTKNKAKKLNVKKILISILACILIQATMAFAFFTFLPDEEPIDRNNLLKFTITVEDTGLIHGGNRSESQFVVYSSGICYRFRDRVFGELNYRQLISEIQIGDVITVLCVEDESGYKSDWHIYEAYSNTQIYRDIDALNKDQKGIRLFLIIISVVFELVFLFLVFGYFYLFFGFTVNRRRSKRM